jgi:hypothetical protein
VSNLIVDRCIALHAEGYHVSSVMISMDGPGRLRVSIGRANMVPIGEGGQSAPHHTVSVDRAALPPGVTCTGWERVEDDVVTLPGNAEQAEALIRDVAQAGRAVDWAQFRGDTPDYPHYLTKPAAWRSDVSR